MKMVSFVCVEGLFFFCEPRIVFPQSIGTPIHSFSYLQRVMLHSHMYPSDMWASPISKDGFSLFCHSRFNSEEPPLILTNDFTHIKLSLCFPGWDSSTQSMAFSVLCGPTAALFPQANLLLTGLVLRVWPKEGGQTKP